MSITSQHFVTTSVKIKPHQLEYLKTHESINFSGMVREMIENKISLEATKEKKVGSLN